MSKHFFIYLLEAYFDDNFNSIQLYRTNKRKQIMNEENDEFYKSF